MSLLSPDKKRAFVHVPKTGGTSIELYLKSIGWHGLKRPPYNKLHHVGFGYIKQHCETVIDAVAVVRNPCEYAVSFYRHWLYRQRQNVENKNYNLAKQHLDWMEEGFMVWFFEHAPKVDRWKGVLQSQRGILSQPDESFDHTRVFEYNQRTDFWQYILGHQPKDEPRVHQFDDVEQVKLSGQDRKKILDYFCLDMETWADQFNWV
jgi:hypothetical protein